MNFPCKNPFQNYNIIPANFQPVGGARNHLILIILLHPPRKHGSAHNIFLAPSNVFASNSWLHAYLRNQ